MWRCRLALLNWVMTKIWSMLACRLLLIGMSISRNLPPMGTAGLARWRVKGQSRAPCPPPRMAVTTFSMDPSPPSGRYLIAGEGTLGWQRDAGPPSVEDGSGLTQLAADRTLAA